jgi:RND family efflux transporter MFP subunit
MLRFYILPALAILGIIMAVRTVVLGAVPPPVIPPLVEPPKAPFENSVAGVGVVESSSLDISVGSPVTTLVRAVSVSVGQNVRRGDILFSLDNREATALLVAKKAEVQVATAEVQEAQDQLTIVQQLVASQAVSTELLVTRRGALARAKARLELALAGVGQVEELLERLEVRAPIDGTVLRADVRPGQLVSAQATTTAPVVVGNILPLHLRVDIDENDAWRITPGATGIAYLRGNPEISVDLSFVRIEPLMIPKRTLSGEASERVDTRVLQVIFKIDPKNAPIYPGQLLDVYVKGSLNPQ